MPLVRAANTGVSAVVDPYGRTVGALPVGVAGVLDAGLPRTLEPTLYARFGDGVFASLLQILRSRRRFLLRISGGRTEGSP